MSYYRLKGQLVNNDNDNDNNNNNQHNDIDRGVPPAPGDDTGPRGRPEQEHDGAATATVPTARRPLGHWLRVVDKRLTREFSAALRDEGVHRREWMLLNAIAGGVEAPEILQRLTRGRGRLPQAARALAECGWIARDNAGGWTVTGKGDAARQRLAGVVNGIRERVAGAVSADDFATTMASLETIARGLGWGESGSDEVDGLRFGPRERRHGHDRRGCGGGRSRDRRGWEERDDRQGRSDRCEHGGWHERGDRREFADRHGHGDWHERSAECDRGRGFGRGYGRGAGRNGEAQRSFERGFAAGFERGRG